MRPKLLTFLCAWFLCAAPLAIAQTPVPPVAVPRGAGVASDNATLSLRSELDQRHAALLERFQRWKSRADAFNHRYGEREFDADSQEAKDGATEQAWLVQESRDYQRVAEAFKADVKRFIDLQSNSCLPLEEQLEREIHALEAQKRSIGAGLGRLDEWTRASEEAQKKALEDAVKPLLVGVGDKLAKRLASARSYEGWLTRYGKQMRELGVPYEALQAKIHRAANGYVNAMVAAAGGVALKEGLKADEAWELVKNEIRSIADAFSQSDDAMREVIAEPELKKIKTTEDHAYLDFTSSFLEMASDSHELAHMFEKVIGTGAVSLGVFIRDYGYDALQWGLSRERILQQASLSEKDLEAIDALKRQLESTMKKRNDCKARATSAQ